MIRIKILESSELYHQIWQPEKDKKYKEDLSSRLPELLWEMLLCPLEVVPKLCALGNPEGGHVGLLVEGGEAEARQHGEGKGEEDEEDGVAGHRPSVPQEVALQPIHCPVPAAILVRITLNGVQMFCIYSIMAPLGYWF